MSDTSTLAPDAPVSLPSSEPASAPSPPSAPAPAPASEPQPSPGSQRDTDRQGLLAAVQDVVKATPDPIVGEPRPEDAASQPPADGTPSPSPGTPQAQPTQPDPLAQDPTDAELSSYKPDTRKRIEQLLAQRTEARQALDRVKPDLDAFAQFKAYQTAHQLENDDINLLLATGAALRRGDFQTFLAGVMPYVEVAQQAMGQLLPADLQGQVDSGQLPIETAREISVNRINQARLQTEATAYRQNAELTGQQMLGQQIYSAVAGWETQVKQRDPDWALKSDIVERFSQSLVQQRGQPTSPQQAVAMAQEAYEEANRVVARMRPQPAATRSQPSGVHQSTGNGAAPQPRNLMEAAILGLQRGNARMH